MPSATQGQAINCKAAVAWRPKEPLVIEEVQVAPPQAGEVRLKITHTSLCHSDLFLWENEGLFPRILGHEAAGIVESIGEGVTHVKRGDHVIPLFTGECGECKKCKSPKTNLCEKLKVDPMQSTMRGDGTSRFSTLKGEVIHHFLNVSSFSEYTVVEAGCVAKIDPTVPLNRACLFACGIPTGVGAVWNTAKLEKGSTVVIFGLGAVGLAVAEGARIAGAYRIIGVDVNPAKFEIGFKCLSWRCRESASVATSTLAHIIHGNLDHVSGCQRTSLPGMAKLFGITEFVNPLDASEPIQNVIRGMTDGGADYCFECVGNVDIMLAAFESCQEGWGKAILVGIEVRPVMLSMHPLKLFDGKEIKGSTFGDFKGRSQLAGLLDMYMKKELKADEFVTHELPFDEINDAFNLLKDGKSLRCVMHMSNLTL